MHEIRTFRTRTAALWRLADGLPAAGCPHVARERPGVSWRPISPLLEGLGTLVVVKAQPRNTGPGRTTAVQDAAWSAELRRHGLWRGRVIPDKPPRQRRERTRHRPTRGQDRARLSHRVPSVDALLPRTQPSQDRGTTSVDSLAQQRVERRRGRRWERLGSQVS
jgi:hypothetical protein